MMSDCDVGSMIRPVGSVSKFGRDAGSMKLQAGSTLIDSGVFELWVALLVTRRTTTKELQIRINQQLNWVLRALNLVFSNQNFKNKIYLVHCESQRLTANVHCYYR